VQIRYRTAHYDCWHATTFSCGTKRLIRLHVSSHDHQPSANITFRLTCWYWYYRQCQNTDRFHHYAHAIKSHVAAKNKADSPIRLDPDLARKRMIAAGVLKDDHERPQIYGPSVAFWGVSQKSSALRPETDNHIKSEPDNSSSSVLQKSSETPILDLLWGDCETNAQHREELLVKVKRELLKPRPC